MQFQRPRCFSFQSPAASFFPIPRSACIFLEEKKSYPPFVVLPPPPLTRSLVSSSRLVPALKALVGPGMAAFRLGTAVEGKSQQGPGGDSMVPAPRLLAANHREEAANGGRARPVVGALRPKKFPAGKPRKRAPIWQAAVFSSVALNVALLLHHFVFSDQLGLGTAPAAHQHQQACLVHPEDAAGGGKSRAQGQKGAMLTRAPSTGKPAVTSDSVINLDQ
jgi:hypothetical protein